LGCSSASLSGCCGTGGIGAAGDRAGFVVRFLFTVELLAQQGVIALKSQPAMM
jgi:hypothetical protein